MTFPSLGRFSPLMVAAVLVAVATPPHSYGYSYGYSVINQRGRVFSVTLTPLFLSLAGMDAGRGVVAQPTKSGQRVMGSDLQTAGVYDNRVGASVPLSGPAQVPPQTGPVGVSIHYN